jgi:hypothetical protein
MDPTTEEQIAAETVRIEAAIKVEMERILEEQRKKREIDFIHAEAMRRIQRNSTLPTYTAAVIQPHTVKLPPTKEQLAEHARVARVNAEAEQAALARRKLAQIEFGEKKAAALAVWINSPMNWDEIQDRQQTVGGFSMVGSGWTKESIEPEFWKWVDSHDGFSVCPTCKNTPKVIRKAYSEQSRAYFYTEGLWKSWEAGPHGSQYGELISIHCCEHLYEYKTQKRYVLSSAMKLKRGTPTTNFIVKERACGIEKDLRMHEIEYSDYNPDDPLGELAYAEKVKADKLQQIDTLRLQLAALESQ